MEAQIIEDKDLIISEEENFDDIKGRTIEERAKLVLLTLGRTKKEIRDAYRKMSKKYYPKKQGEDGQYFQLVNEANVFLTTGRIPKRNERILLEDDALLSELISLNLGRKIHLEPLMKPYNEWEEDERWRRDHFYGVEVGVI